MTTDTHLPPQQNIPIPNANGIGISGHIAPCEFLAMWITWQRLHVDSGYSERQALLSPMCHRANATAS